jgi:hypothetical protein
MLPVLFGTLVDLVNLAGSGGLFNRRLLIYTRVIGGSGGSGCRLGFMVPRFICAFQAIICFSIHKKAFSSCCEICAMKQTEKEKGDRLLNHLYPRSKKCYYDLVLPGTVTSADLFEACFLPR